MSQSGSTSRTVGSLGSSTDSGGGSFTTRKDFGNRQRKVVRILTVVAYIMSVSMVALLLSAYYVFIWEPEGTTANPLAHRRPTEYPMTSNRHSSSSALHVQQTRVSKKSHKNTMMPTPQSLILEMILEEVADNTGSTTTPQRNPASPPDDPDAPHKRKTTPQEQITEVPTTAATLLKMTTTTKPAVFLGSFVMAKEAVVGDVQENQFQEQEDDVRHMIT